MRKTVILPIVALALLLALSACSASLRANEPQPAPLAKPVPVELRIAKDGWGGVRTETVERMLQSVVREMWPYFPGRTLPPIHVEAKGGPIVLFDRGDGGEIRVKLNTGDTYWAQYAYQFSHEFCHILCNYDPDPCPSKWFEESVCEVASLFALRRMSETWKTDPPFGHWKDFAPHLASYAKDRLDQHHLPENMTLAEWYARERESLHGSATDRERNTIIASALLPHFEKEPAHWEAVTWLNAGKPDKTQTFEAYLSDWRKHAPKKHHAFIDAIADEFGVKIDSAAE